MDDYNEFTPLELLSLSDLEGQLQLLERFAPDLDHGSSKYWTRRVQLIKEAIAERILLLESNEDK